MGSYRQLHITNGAVTDRPTALSLSQPSASPHGTGTPLAVDEDDLKKTGSLRLKDATPCLTMLPEPVRAHKLLSEASEASAIPGFFIDR